mmetsp:Transcript_85045/g.221972  ORF Transcript_85045/g.221972 Transcript_85045/m.221972 type:complete len:263 (-) Transcript_85045:101-889(-)
MCTTLFAMFETSIKGSTSLRSLPSTVACSAPLSLPRGADMSVKVLPMSICPQAMSKGLPSKAVDFVSPVTACFEAVYAADMGRGRSADTDPLLMILPPRGFCDFMSLKACWVHRNVPVTLASMHRLKASTDTSSIGVGGTPVPALLNNKSQRPKRCSTSLNSLSTSAHLQTSHVTAATSTCAASLFIKATVSSRASLLRPASATHEKLPDFARAMADARPTPLPAPVTTATFTGMAFAGRKRLSGDSPVAVRLVGNVTTTFA